MRSVSPPRRLLLIHTFAQGPRRAATPRKINKTPMANGNQAHRKANPKLPSRASTLIHRPASRVNTAPTAMGTNHQPQERSGSKGSSRTSKRLKVAGLKFQVNHSLAGSSDLLSPNLKPATSGRQVPEQNSGPIQDFSTAPIGQRNNLGPATVALTPRETEVLQLLAQGLANKQIALALGISEHTIKFHVSSIYAKLGVGNRTEAVRVGARQGLILL